MLVGLAVEHPRWRYEVQPVYLLCRAESSRVRQRTKFLVHRLRPDDRILIRACFLVRRRRQKLAHRACGHGSILVLRSLVRNYMAYTFPLCHQRQQPMPRTPLAPRSFPPVTTPLYIDVIWDPSPLAPRC